MYSDRDALEADARVRRASIALAAVLAALLAALVAALAFRWKWLAFTAGPALFIAGLVGFGCGILPWLRYRKFLREMRTGLAREAEGELVSIAKAAEDCDGCRVLPVILADATAEGGERIVYLNAAKAGAFPGAGERVRLSLYGRHIRDFERLPEKEAT